MGIDQWLTSFVASAGFGLLFHVPRKSLIPCGIVGMLGWIVYQVATGAGISAIGASLAASVFIALLSQLCAKWLKTPMIVFSAAGIIPLVPGGLAYDAMRKLVENDYTSAVQLATQAFMISGAIAIGLMISGIFYPLRRKGTAKTLKDAP